jgi:rubrerythrin
LSIKDAPSDFPEVDENIETQHVCPKCGYRFSGGETASKVESDDSSSNS